MKKLLLSISTVVFSVLLLTGVGLCSSVSNIHFSPGSPSALPFGQDINVTFDYSSTEAGGILIFARPMTNGGLTPNYSASGSPLYPAGTGSGTGTFTITGGETTVDQIRFTITNADQSAILGRFFIPVVYHFYDTPISVTNIRTSSPYPASMAFGQDVDITFDYSTVIEVPSFLIFARPMTNGELTPNYSASGSPLYLAGTGSGTGTFTITGGETTVDQVRFRITNADQSAILAEFFIPVRYSFPVEFTSAPAVAPVLTVSQYEGNVTLSWTSAPTATGYLIGYAPYPNADYIEVLDVGNKTSFSFDLFSGSVAYYAVVVPYNDNGWGTPSNIENFFWPLIP